MSESPMGYGLEHRCNMAMKVARVRGGDMAMIAAKAGREEGSS